jgi:hypothetical protein
MRVIAITIDIRVWDVLIWCTLGVRLKGQRSTGTRKHGARSQEEKAGRKHGARRQNVATPISRRAPCHNPPWPVRSRYGLLVACFDAVVRRIARGYLSGFNRGCFISLFEQLKYADAQRAHAYDERENCDD